MLQKLHDGSRMLMKVFVKIGRRGRPAPNAMICLPTAGKLG